MLKVEATDLRLIYLWLLDDEVVDIFDDDEVEVLYQNALKKNQIALVIKLQYELDELDEFEVYVLDVIEEIPVSEILLLIDDDEVELVVIPEMIDEIDDEPECEKPVVVVMCTDDDIEKSDSNDEHLI